MKLSRKGWFGCEEHGATIVWERTRDNDGYDIILSPAREFIHKQQKWSVDGKVRRIQNYQWAIKAEGGVTFAQDDSAKCDSMPRSAVAAGCVDQTNFYCREFP